MERREGGTGLSADKAAIREAVENWALYRDTGRWDALLRLYTPDAIVHTTWFVGSAREFVERGKQAAARGGSRGQHFVGAISVEVAGDRAIAETRAMLLVRAPLQGVEVDVTCYCRFYDWFVRMDGGWRIKMRGGIYEKDRIDPVDPSQRITLDPAVLARFPYGYRHVAYVQSSNGHHHARPADARKRGAREALCRRQRLAP
jgi:ketosteroid isomerase-like protein